MVSDAVMIAYLNHQADIPLLTMAVAFVMLIAFLAILSAICEPSKSKKARETFADLYVIGKIRQFAKEDGIILDDEMKELRRLEKLEKMSTESLDKTVERELQEKITVENQKKIESMKK